MGYQRIEVEAITPLIGAEVRGVRLSECDDDSFSEIQEAWAEHLVLFFRDQTLDVDEQLAFASRFGVPHIHPSTQTAEGHPEVMVIHADEKSRYVAGHGWHTDVSCDEKPPAASILYLHTTPPSGGDTLFASMYEAYDRLSEPMKEFLGARTAIHESAHIYGGAYGRRPEDARDREFPSAEHPVIRTHPVTGRKALYVNRGFTRRIRGLRRAESEALLGFLYLHAEQPEVQCRFRWTPNTVAIWDNRCTQHHAMWDYRPHVRSGFRVSVVGERPV
jgi:taurine dioxygenase